MDATASPTVLVVDDDPAARQATATLAQSMGLAAQAYASAAELLAACDPSRPGCVVTDLRLRGTSGLELQQALAQRGVELPVIVLTAHADVPTTVKVLTGGAVTLLEKPCRGRDLESAIRAAIQRDAERRRRHAMRAQVQARLAQLTAPQRRVLDLMLAGHKNKAIALAEGCALRTVEARRQAVFRKMEVDSLAALVRLMVQAEAPDHPPAK